jgi:hypothetical protein
MNPPPFVLAVQRLYILEPPSDAIAFVLNVTGAKFCDCGRNPCFLRCGVRTGARAPFLWEVIPRSERLAWLTKLLDAAERFSRGDEPPAKT